MTSSGPFASDCAEFYRLRNQRTETYIERAWMPTRTVRVAIDAESAESEVGQHLLLSLVNILARAHRRIIVTMPTGAIPLRTFSLVSAPTLREATLATANAIDPCGQFDDAVDGGDITIGIGSNAEMGLDWYLGANRAVGRLDVKPMTLNTNTRASLRGAGVAAVLGAAAVFKAELGLSIVPRTLSAWNYREAEAAAYGPDSLEPLNVGRVLLVGAGAVAAGLVYWLRSWGVEGEWVVADRDVVKLHNTNRGMLFLPSHAGWPAGVEQSKASLLATLLPAAQSVRNWYHSLETELRDSSFDVVLALANDHGVRRQLAERNSIVLLHATTGNNWLSQLHRHIAGHDDCIDCRLPTDTPIEFACSTAPISSAAEERVDAALPFLSAASGLMLATALQRLQLGVLADVPQNNWRWDFLSDYAMAATPARSRCRDSCRSWYSPKIRAMRNQGTRWAHLDRSHSLG